MLIFTQKVSASEFIKRDNDPVAFFVAIDMTPLRLLEEREPAKLVSLRRLFDYEKNSNAQIRG